MSVAIAQEVDPFGVKMQTIEPGVYLTHHYGKTADNAFRLCAGTKNFTKRDKLRATFDVRLASRQEHLDSHDMIVRIIVNAIAIGRFRLLISPIAVIF